MAKITVIATADAGIHPIHGPIIAGQSYEIEADQFAEELFDKPGTGRLARGAGKTESQEPGA